MEVRGLTKRYPGASGEAVAGVDLEVGEGERFVVVGPSGSGKTTLLRLVAGLESPTAGAVLIGGRRMDGVAPRDRGVGMVFQHPALYPHLDVAANLAFGLRARGVPGAERSARTAEVAGWLGLGGLMRRKPRALSGGERQRVALGRAAVARPSVLLLDEPFSSLDAPLRASTRAAMLDLHERVGGALILVTHDQTEALAVGQRIAVMRGGRIEQVGTPREVYDEPATRFVAGFVGDPPTSFLLGRVAGGRMALPGGAEIPAPDLGRATAWLGLRPEDVAVEGDGEHSPSTARVPATLDRIEPRGHEAIARFLVGGEPIAARVGPDFARRPGEEVPIRLDLASARWFSDDGGEPRIGRPP